MSTADVILDPASTKFRRHLPLQFGLAAFTEMGTNL